MVDYIPTLIRGAASKPGEWCTDSLELYLEPWVLDKLTTDGKMRAMLFCTRFHFERNWEGSIRPVYISYPRHMEVRVNNIRVKALTNIRGKGGFGDDVLPIDVTDYLHFGRGFNDLEITYGMNVEVCWGATSDPGNTKKPNIRLTAPYLCSRIPVQSTSSS